MSFMLKDFQWAKDRICQMSGWKINCEKYKATESLFNNIWASLVQVRTKMRILDLQSEYFF